MTPDKPGFVLPRTGKAPLHLTGALLVKAAITHQEGHEPCRLAVYETSAGFVAHVQLWPSPGSTGMSVVHQTGDPAALRRWIAGFDPAIAVDVSDITPAALQANAEGDAGLAHTARIIKLRLAEMRNAYLSAVQAAFGDGLNRPSVFP
ncbi:MAG: hypothetical protein AAF221_05870 [Pseudomonadota bacterium]